MPHNKSAKQNRVFVLNHDRSPLMPCHPKRARELLKNKRAAVFQRFPFTIILKEQIIDPKTQPLVNGIDSGAKTTGESLILKGKHGDYVVFGAELQHRTDISEKLTKRAATRRSRRSRNTRYRPARFLNRLNRKGKIPPSAQSKVDNVTAWTKRFRKLCPLSEVRLETAKFDTQKLQNPNISGEQYQQGPKYGYENARQYILQRDGYRCQYCGTEGSASNPFELDHVHPKSKGGSDRMGNLLLSCHNCNQAKDNMSLTEFVKNKAKLAKIREKLDQPLASAGQVNSLRSQLLKELTDYCQENKMVFSVGFGYQTNANRKALNLPKAHWIDAVVCTEKGNNIKVNAELQPLKIRATGRGCRQMCQMNKYGFPKTNPKDRTKNYFGFQTGDIVKAVVPAGYKLPQGTYVKRVSVRKTGYFYIKVNGKEATVFHRFCKKIHTADGYTYAY